MEDSLSYMNAVGESSSVLNQITALKEQAAMKFQESKQTEGQEIEIPSDLALTTIGGVVIKKVVSAVAEKLGSSVSNIASKVGISEDTVSKALSGDVQGALEQGSQEVGQAATNLLGNVGETITGAISGATGEAGAIAGGVEGAVSSATGEAGAIAGGLEGAVSNITTSIAGSAGSIGSSLGSSFGGLSDQVASLASGIVGRASTVLENVPSLMSPTTTAESLSNVYEQGLQDVQAQFGFTGSASTSTTVAGSEVEMQDVLSFPSTAAESTAAETAATTADAADVAATTAAEAASGAAAAADAAAGVATGVATAAEVGGAVAGEAAGIAVSSVLGPLGLLAGLIGGIVGAIEGTKQSSETAPTPYVPLLNPSSQFL